MTLAEISQRLTEITGMPHLTALGASGMVSVETDAPVLDSTDLVVLDAPVDQATVTPSAEPSEAERMRIRPSLRGPLSLVLDEVASAFSVEWAYRDGRIVFRDFVTRQYQISALPNRSTISSRIGAGEMESSTALATDVWGEIESSLKGILTAGSTVSLGSSTGLVTVTAQLADHDRISDYLSDLNEAVSQQISFDVNVLTVSSTDAEGYGINLSSLLQGSDGSVDILGNEALPGGVGSVNIGLITGELDLDLVVQALSRQGRVSVDTRAGATTSNNRVVPIKVTDRLSYIKSQEVATDTNGGQTRSIQTDEIETGFQLQIFPRVLNNREVMVQYTVGLSELRGIQTFGDGVDTIQLPQVSETSFEQQAVIQNGQTLILAGFERERTQVTRSGTGNAAFPLFGGGRNATYEKVSTVLMITPRILNRRSPVRSE
jgi:type II secretory pathway component GspD/PulD (secretin)